jgi:hypothetical protein
MLPADNLFSGTESVFESSYFLNMSKYPPFGVWTPKALTHLQNIATELRRRSLSSGLQVQSLFL